ncbi:hypothetical protein CAPTEDRAFT_169044 [Capitella teleta]|uniref:C2H2-type domain-containing protein n=1 Tax=Capitella teleta TaxID=283909 RepID=R7TWD8_CAPTE|nr:hypothetical protein CAPTEDRAFT_169044 [Capitella teleta]|eukprot:ELT95290.1 hypothetical protein CAPTEDRAFT_169044 [Capitella teleta]
MGSLQQVQFEFPVAFLEALVTAPFNTNIMLMDAQFENKDECNFLGWKSEEIVTLVLEGKETGLNIQTIDNALCFRVLSGAGEERAPPEEELKEEPMQEDVEEPMLEEVEQEPEAPVTAETYEIVLEQPMPTQELQEGEIHAITEDSIITAAEMTNDSPYSKVLYMCPDDGCILEFADIGGLMKHINSDRHRNQSNHPFLTEIVKQMEKSVVSDTEILRITCPLCQAQVGPKTAFRHIGDEHSDHPQYEFAVSYCKDTIRQHRKNRDLERTPGGKLCPHCGKQYNGLKNWRRHVKHWCSQNPSRVQVFLCTKCSFQSVDPQKFEAHQSRHLEDRDSHVCTLCQKPFKSEYGLGTHMSLMHGDQVKVLPYKCRECSHSCETEEEHKEHMLTHKAKRFKCELCTAVYKNLTTLRHHIKQYHAGEFPLHCEKCGSGIANHEAVPLHRHLNTAHKDDPFYQQALECCDYIQVTRRANKARQAQVEAKCDFCHKGFGCVDRMRLHSRYHCPKTPDFHKLRTCSQCAFQTTYRAKFVQHVASCHVGTVLCLHCEEIFADVESMNEHMQNQHSWLELLPCHLCEAITLSEENFDSHMMSHQPGEDSVHSLEKSGACLHSVYIIMFFFLVCRERRLLPVDILPVLQ